MAHGSIVPIPCPFAVASLLFPSYRCSLLLELTLSKLSFHTSLPTACLLTCASHLELNHGRNTFLWPEPLLETPTLRNEPPLVSTDYDRPGFILFRKLIAN
jgi:hypothetical protein